MSDSDKSSNEEYEVEQILEKRTMAGKVQYLIKWKGWSAKDATWEPTANLSNVNHLVEEYESSLKKKTKVVSEEKELKKKSKKSPDSDEEEKQQKKPKKASKLISDDDDSGEENKKKKK
jgi:hypothetical protein